MRRLEADFAMAMSDYNTERPLRRNRKVTADQLITEADVALGCIEYLRAKGWMVHRLQADRHANGGNRKRHEKEEPGTPDYICHKIVNNGLGHSHVFYLETKRPKGKLRQSQIAWQFAHSHENICVARSVENLKEFLQCL